MNTETTFTEELIMPNEFAAETEVLAGIMLDNKLTAQAAMHLQPQDFFKTPHRHIYRAMLDMWRDSRPIDPVTLEAELRHRDQIEQVGGIAYIAELLTGYFRTFSFPEYVRLVKEASARRFLITSSNKIASAAFDTTEELGDVLGSAQTALTEVTRRQEIAEVVSVADTARNQINQIEEITNRKGVAVGVTTGFEELDRLTNGLQNSDLVIIAARPSMGKTALGMNICEKAALSGVPTLVFSMEMSKEALSRRLLCSIAKVDMHRFSGGFLSKDEYARLGQAMQTISGIEDKLFIWDQPGISILDILSRAQQIKSKYGLGLILVDYLQLMRAPGRVESRYQEVSQIARDLKAAAKELDVPLIALSQLSRKIEDRASRRPQLSDLRESGDIEQAADLVMFIHRDEYYGATDENAGEAEIIIGKQRNGPTDSLRLAFIKQFTRFENRWAEV